MNKAPVSQRELTLVYEALKVAKAVENENGKLVCHWTDGQLVCYVDQKVCRLSEHFDAFNSSRVPERTPK